MTFAKQMDATIHIIGIVCSLVASLAVIILVSNSSINDQIAVWTYCILSIVAFVLSAVYHLTNNKARRSIFRRLDYASIFLKIAGTYTPLVVIIGGSFSFAVLAIIWTLSIFGAISRLFYWSKPCPKLIFWYTILCWFGIVLACLMIKTIPLISFWLILVGGIVYTAGIYFLMNTSKFSNAIWHSFVLVGSAFHFGAIYIAESNLLN